MAADGVGRLAPSPTGAQHVGNARTYLITWLSARSQGLKLHLRIEDIDSPRVKPWAVDQIYDDLNWLGLDYDAGPVFQTHRLTEYEAALETLKSAELVYPCTCTRGDIAAAASAPHAGDEGPVYPGTCAGRTAADAASLAGPFAWRFRAAAVGPWRDRVCGEVDIDPRTAGGDFVVWKSAGSPAYQLAVVVDDIAAGVTEVVRGDDLLPSTPRQVLIYRALGAAPPAFAHVPLVVGTDGRRLAKRHGDTRLSSLRAAGVGPEALLGLLAWSCGWRAGPTPASARELLAAFSWAAIPPRPLVLTPEMLAGAGCGGGKN